MRPRNLLRSRVWAPNPVEFDGVRPVSYEVKARLLDTASLQKKPPSKTMGGGKHQDQLAFMA
jgi:hypothetical protein